MNGTKLAKLAFVFWLTLWYATLASQAQLIPPDPFYQLNDWQFQAPDYLSDAGDGPLGFTNINNPVSFDGNALQVDAPSNEVAFINYPIKDSISTNVMFFECTIEVWTLPDWNSGAGPGGWGRIVDIGQFSTNSPSSWFSLYFSPDGSSINFSSITNGLFTNYLSCPIAWSTNAWHLLDLTWNRDASKLYIDGQLAASGHGVFYEPSAAAETNGFFIGSASGGTPATQARAQFDDLATWSYALDAEEITNDYAAGLQAMNGSGPGFGDYTPVFPGGGTNGFGGGTNMPDSYTNTYDYGTNLWIAQVHIASNYLNAIGSNTIADVPYEIQSWTNLAMAANWVSQGFIVGSETTNWTPLNPLPASRTNNFFIRLRSWASDDGTGIPTWWELEYFGTNAVDPNALDAVGDGYTIDQKYQMGLSPNTWATPEAPQGFTAIYAPSTGTATASWLPSPGAVTGYILTLPSGITTSLPATATNYVDDDTNLAAALSPVSFYAYYGTSFTLQASYTEGLSAVATANLRPFDPSISIIQGANGSNYLAVSPFPPGTVGVLLTRVDVDATFSYGDASFNVSNAIPIASFTNGLCLIPPGLTTAPVDSYGNAQYEWFAQTIDGEGVATSFPDDLGDNAVTNVTYGVDAINPFYFDGREQLKQNLSFLLRVATASTPYSYVLAGSGVTATMPTNYVYASFNNYIYTNSAYQITQNPLSPFNDNYAFYGHVFSLTNLGSGGGLMDTSFPFPTPAPGTANIPALLGDSDWLTPANDYDSSRNYYYYGPTNYSDPDIAIGFDYQGNLGGIYVFGTYHMMGGITNIYGLGYVSVEATAGTGNGPTNVLLTPAGGDITDYYISYFSVVYFFTETAQPVFHTTEYDFWPATANPTNSIPGTPQFSTTGTSSLLITSVGAPGYTVMGYAKLAVANGNSGVSGYLGQYFDQAYAIDTNDVVTTNSTGVVSPYGSYFATEPGPAALVTMPDVDPPYERGTCIVYAVSLQLDANHDGNMDLSYGGTDATSPDKPMQFWCNNNYDRWDNDYPFNTPEQDGQLIGFCPAYPSIPTPDCNYSNVDDYLTGFRAIPCTRDLQDFARLWMCGLTTNLLAALPYGSSVTLSMGSVSDGNPTIDLFEAADANGGIEYQTNETVAELQTNLLFCPYVTRLGPGNSIQLNSLENKIATPYFIWCGVSNGTGGLTLTIKDNHGNTLAQSTAYIQIQDIKQMYERWTVGDNSALPATPYASLSTEGLAPGAPPFRYPPPPTTNTPYILLVHGYNMAAWEKDSFAESAYKRLYWQGYQGRFGAFNWPTASQPLEFGSSEAQAWDSAQALMLKLSDLDVKYPGRVYLAAHSLGNVVAGEALRLASPNPIVNTYVAMQGAVTAHAYDPTTPVYTLYYDSGTPDCYANYWTGGAPCYFHATAGADVYVNYYNTNDWALNVAWLAFENAKPLLNPSYEFDSPDLYYKNFGLTELYFPTNTYELFDHLIQARSYALGMQPYVGGVFAGSQLNLPTVWPPDTHLRHDYSTHVWHSAEFRSDNQQRWQYWNRFLIDCELKAP